MKIFSGTFFLIPAQPGVRRVVTDLKTGLIKTQININNFGMVYLVTLSEMAKKLGATAGEGPRPDALMKLRKAIREKGLIVLG